VAGLCATESELLTGTAARTGTHKRPLLVVDGKRYGLKPSGKADALVTEALAAFPKGDTGAQSRPGLGLNSANGPLRPASLSAPAGCDGARGPSIRAATEPEQPRPAPLDSEGPAPGPFLSGVDANYALMMAGQGASWKSGSKTVDLLSELQRNGADAFRVRVWTGNDGPSGLAYATEIAGQAQRAGLKPHLVLFLSEDWSDLMKQPAPLAWRDRPFDEKLVQVKRYAQETARQFLGAGIRSDLYETGNEVDFGLCGEFEESWANRVSAQYMGERIWPKEARIIRAAQEGVLAANPQARFMLHLARWWEPDYAVAFLQAMDRETIRVDHLGLTYYPSSGLAPSNGMADLDRAVRRIQEWRKLPVIVCEYAYPSEPNFAGQFSSWNKPVDDYPLTEAGQARWIADFLAFCRQHPYIQGAFYWSPEWSSPEMWSAFALFRPDGSAKPGLAALARP
jgi:arabinogalactan endo-1,4-beta-galactosidase